MKTTFLFSLLFFGLLLAACHKQEGGKSKVLRSSKPPAGIPVRVSTICILIPNGKPQKGSGECFVNLAGGKCYTLPEAPEHTSEIDFCWTTGDSFEGLFSLDAPGLRYAPAGYGQNRTLLARTEKISPADFELVQTTAQLLRLWNRDPPMNTAAPFRASTADAKAVYLFETAQHKRGLFRFLKPHTGTSGEACLEARMEP